MVVANTEPVMTPEARVSLYSEAWQKALKWKTRLDATVDSPLPKNIHVLSLLTPPQQVIDEVESDPKRHIEVDETMKFVFDTVADYASSGPFAHHIPPDIHIILFPQAKDNDLFPEHNERAGFHLRRGGYLVMLIPMRQKTDGSYGLQPFVIGHELGEIAVSHMLRSLTGTMGQMANKESHPLKEGFCDNCGLDFYRFLAEKQGGSFTDSYDEIQRDEYTKHNLPHLLGELPFEQVSEKDQQFLQYLIGGSIVSKLIRKYGFEKVSEYFADEAIASAREDADFQAILEKLNTSSGGITFSFRTERSASPPQNKQLNELLNLLGYKADQFISLDSSTKPVDNKPEGAIAALIVDQFSDWFKPKDERVYGPPEQADRLDHVEESGVQIKKPSFIQSVISGIDPTIANKHFGADFSPEIFIAQWRDDFLKENKSEVK